MKVDLRIDDKCVEPYAVIVTRELTDEISDLMIWLSDGPHGIAGFDDGTAKLLEPKDIIRIYSSGGKVFAVTDSGEWALRLRLYEAEERLAGSRFVRISSSEIINIKKAVKFDLSTVGTIMVTLSDGQVSFVSRRFVAKIKKTLGL